MPCFHPIKAWRTTENTPNGKKRIAFQRSANSTTPLQLPCNQCIGCRLDRSLQWALRCVHEAQLHDQNSFITLTYSPEHHPQDGSLTKSHFQNFIRKLRYHFSERRLNPETGRLKRYPTATVRYFMCGEYGENFNRPHYHACLFGVHFPDREVIKESEGIILYNSPTLDSIWGKGFTSIGDVTFETAAYTARYITKKITGEKAQDHYQTSCQHTGNLIALEPEYTTMSLKPGIAADWFAKYKTDLYPSDFAVHQGKRVKIPRYYDKRMELEDEDFETIKLQRKQNARKFLSENTPERLAVREKIKHLNFKKLTRSYENDS